jgi:hypothetical protein
VTGQLQLYEAIFKKIYYDSFNCIMEMAIWCTSETTDRISTESGARGVFEIYSCLYQLNITSLQQIIISNSILSIFVHKKLVPT